MATWLVKVNARPAGTEAAITGESHTIGTYETSKIFLNEVPLQEGPSTVTISGMTEVTTAPATSTEFKVNYSGRLAGAIEFHSTATGSVSVSYKGRGSALYSHHINLLQTEKLDRDGAIPLTGFLTWTAGSAPAAPAAGYARVWYNSADKKFYYIDSDNTAKSMGGADTSAALTWTALQTYNAGIKIASGQSITFGDNTTQTTAAPSKSMVADIAGAGDGMLRDAINKANVSGLVV